MKQVSVSYCMEEVFSHGVGPSSRQGLGKELVVTCIYSARILYFTYSLTVLSHRSRHALKKAREEDEDVHSRPS